MVSILKEIFMSIYIIYIYVYMKMFESKEICLHVYGTVTPQIPGVPLTTCEPAEYSWMSGNPTPLTKIGQSLLCTGSSTQIQHVPNSLQ